MDIIETIRKRKSCRTYIHVALTPADKKNLESYIIEDSKGFENEVVNFNIIEKNNDDKQMKLDYGMIQGHTTYILGTSKSTVASRVNYGYLMEKVVLKATEMNLSTCWIGAFDSAYFNEVFIEDGFDIPSILIVEYSDALEMVRLAPSSGNTQPWRVFFDETLKEFHFFKKVISKRYELKGLHDIDMGIAMSHFELTSLQNGLSGRWLKHAKENVEPIDELQYIMTWKCG